MELTKNELRQLIPLNKKGLPKNEGFQKIEYLLLNYQFSQEELTWLQKSLISLSGENPTNV